MRETTIGDLGFADDTRLIGFADEMKEAEQITIQTMGDWEEKVNMAKTETHTKQ